MTDEFEPRRLKKSLVKDKTSGRSAKPRVSAKKHTESSKKWLDRQLADPYVQKAKAAGYRSRAAFKLIELNDRFRFLKPGQSVVDLGCAPGGWLQIVQEYKPSQLVGIDILPTDPMPGVTLLEMDFSTDEAPTALQDALGGQQADVVLSDIAPNTTGHARTDHLRIIHLVELAVAFSIQILKPGGVFVTKVFQGGASDEILATLRQNFETVKHAKPGASRQGSAETYLVATGFKY